MPMQHPAFDPVALSLGPVAIHWYGLMYLVAFVLFYLLGRYRIQKGTTNLTLQDLEDLVFFGALGVILGGRIGYILFYDLATHLQNPLQILMIWKGGMSFHGGFLGVLVAMLWFARSRKRSWLDITDFIAPLVPTGLAAGRMGNFINGELWGRVTDPAAFWAMLFPQARNADAALAAANPSLMPLLQQYGALPRHPSQLYQFALEGLLLFIILWAYSSRPRATGAVSGVFLIGYGSFRFIAEFARQPDAQLGLLAGGMSMGQWLSLPMILAGVAMWAWAVRGGAAAPAQRAAGKSR
jgi:phosphatidylglycerol---prolipoprotein diacylglyceryl transferase